MRRLALLALVLAACAPPPPAYPASTSLASASSCRLAVVQGSPGQGGGPQTPGFLTIPGNQFTAAVGAGDGTYYDKPLKRWVLFGGQALSADGTRYAYSEFITGTKTTRIHLVDVRSGSDRIIASGGPWRGIGLSGNAFFAMAYDFVETNAFGNLEVGKGLTRIPLDGGAPSQLTSDSRDWVWVADGGVYGDGSTVDVAGGPNDVVRYDLSTGRQTTVFDKHLRSRILSVDAKGTMLVTAEGVDYAVWAVTTPGNAVQVWSGSMHGPIPEGPVAVDGSDVWLSGSSLVREWVIFHYSPQAMQQVALFTDRPYSVAGPCA